MDKNLMLQEISEGRMPESKEQLYLNIIRQLISYCRDVDLENAAMQAWLKTAKLEPKFREFFEGEIRNSDRYRTLVTAKWSAVTDAIEACSKDESPEKLRQMWSKRIQ
jgi:hypothetical protein